MRQFTTVELLTIRNALDMHPLPADFAPSDGETLADAKARECAAMDAISMKITAMLGGE